MPLAEAPSLTITGAQGAFFLAGIQLPIEKGELKLTAVKSEATGSTDIGSDGKVWSVFGEGKSGWTFNADANWRPGAGIIPPNIRKGATYAVVLYVRRPGYGGSGDAGQGWNGYLFIEDVSLTFDPGAGKWDFKISGTGQGELASFG